MSRQPLIAVFVLAAGAAFAQGGDTPPQPRPEIVEPDVPEVIQVEPETEDTCGAAGFQGLVGQPRAVVDLLELDRPMRIVPHDGMVTMDFRPDRINFSLTEEGRVDRVTCG